MKKKKIFGGIAVLFFLLVAAIAALPWVIDINDYRDDIEGLIEKSVRADVEIGHLKLSFFPYLGVRVQDLSLTTGGEKLLEQREMAFQVHLKSLFSGRIIASLHLKEPKLQLIKNAQGLNIADILPKEEKSSPEKTELPAWIARVLVEEVELTKATLQYTDRTASSPSTMTIAPINLRMSDIQLADPEKPMRIEFSARYGEYPISLTTLMWVHVSQGSLRLGEGKIEVAGQKFTFQANAKGLKSESPSFAGSVNADEITYGEWKINQMQAKWDATSQRARLQRLDFNIFEGAGRAEGSLVLQGPSTYTVQTTLEKINVAKLLPSITGTGNVTLKLNGQMEPGKTFEEQVNGSGEVRLVDGKVKTMNLMQEVLSEKLVQVMQAVLAGRSTIVALPGREVEGTSFREIVFPFTIQQGRLIVEKMRLEHNQYGALFNGSIGFDHSLDLKGSFLLPPEASAQLIPHEKIRSYLVNEEGKFMVPLQLQGFISHPGVSPDVGFVEKKMAQAAQKAFTEEVQQKVLPKILDEVQPDPSEVKKKIKDIFGL